MLYSIYFASADKSICNDHSKILVSQSHPSLSLKVACYSFPKKNMKILKSLKFKQQDVCSEVFVTAVDVKSNFTKQINANQGKMLNIETELLEGD